MCNLQVAAVKLAHDTGNPVQHPILDRVRSCSSHPDHAASFFESLFCPVPEQRLLPHQALSHPYLKLSVDTMLRDQARMGLHIVSRADGEVVSPRGCDNDEARGVGGFDSDENWGVGPVGSLDSSGLGKKQSAPTFHSRSKQLRRSKRHWWQSDKKRDAYGAADDVPYSVGQPKQTASASHSTAHMKHELYWPRTFEPSDFKVDKGAKEATGTVLSLLSPAKSKVTSHAGGGQARAALQHNSNLITSSMSIAAVSSLQRLAAANSQTIAATAAQTDGVLVSLDGMHASVGHAAGDSQLLQPFECSWQQADCDEFAPGTTSTGGSAQAIQDTSSGHHEPQHGTEQGQTW